MFITSQKKQDDDLSEVGFALAIPEIAQRFGISEDAARALVEDGLRSNYLGWIKVSLRYLLPIVLFTGFVLFAPPAAVSAFGLTELLGHYRPYFSLGFFLSYALFLTVLLVWGYDWIKKRGRAAQTSEELRQSLYRLSGPEKEILRSYIHKATC